MSRTPMLLRRLARCQSGASAMEYGLLLALLSVVVIGAVNAAGVNLYATMSNLSNRIAAAH